MVEQSVSSVCRICTGSCGLIVKKEGDKITSVRGDKEHPMTKGYACIKGLESGCGLQASDRLLKPLKKMPDGRFSPIPLNQALDEIAEKVKGFREAYSPRAIATFKGTQAYQNVPLAHMLRAWMTAIESPNLFSTMTIDQSAKIVSVCRLGMWGADRHHMQDSDVLMIVGGNPLVSIGVLGITVFNTTKQFKAAKKRGLKLIVIDPRESETAKFADLHLQIKPGQDAVLLAAIIREVLQQGWEDKQFCTDYVAQMDALREMVADVNLDFAEQRTGISRDKIKQAAHIFSFQGTRGFATTGTGPSLAPHSNLSEHLAECLNVICGRYNREGEKVRSGGLLRPRPAVAEVIPPTRPWEQGPKSSVRGFGLIGGEMPSATLPEEILDATPDNKIRALFVSAANPAVAFPDQETTVAALKALELLVVIDPYMTATAKLADYIIPPKIMYERDDVYLGPDLDQFIPEPFQQYIPAIVNPPEGSEVIDDWQVFWEIAKRLGKQVNFYGHPLNMEQAPSSEDLIRYCMDNSPISLDELKEYPRGKIFDLPPVLAKAGRKSPELRFQVMPKDVADELKSAMALEQTSEEFNYLLISRRIREVMNTVGMNWPGCRRTAKFNPLWVHPDDAKDIQVETGDKVEIRSTHGAIKAVVELDSSTRRGVVAISHCWGDLPDNNDDYETLGVNTNLITRLDVDHQDINAMPLMSSIPVHICKTGAANI